MTLDDWVSVVDEYGLENEREYRVALALIEVAKAANGYTKNPTPSTYDRFFHALAALDKELEG